MADIDHLIERRDLAREQFATIGAMRPGTLQTHFTKCGKPNCRCAHDDAARHGPHYMVSRSLEGQMKYQRLRADEVEVAQGQLDEYKRFQSISVAFIRASEDLAEARRLALREGNPVKKKTLKRLPIRSPPPWLRISRCWLERGSSKTATSRRWSGRPELPRCRWRANLWSNTSTPISATCRGPALPAPAAGMRPVPDAGRRP